MCHCEATGTAAATVTVFILTFLCHNDSHICTQTSSWVSDRWPFEAYSMSHIQKIRNHSKQSIQRTLFHRCKWKMALARKQHLRPSRLNKVLLVVDSVRFSRLRIRLWDECDLQILPSQHDLSQRHIHNFKIEIARNVRMGMGVPSNCELVGEPLK